MKTLTFVDADANANAYADAEGSTIALCERCSSELITERSVEGGGNFLSID